MKVTRARISDILIIEPERFTDQRGFFLEAYHAERYKANGITREFVQDNHSRSQKGVLRGLHFQHPWDQGKLIYVPRGRIFDVAVDIRRGSPSFGKWVGVELSDQNGKQIYIPEGFAHGFCVLSDEADVIYKCTALYNPEYEHGVLWCDPDIGIKWPISEPILSDKDKRNPILRDIQASYLPVYMNKN